MAPLTEISGPPADITVSGGWIFDRIEDWAKREPSRRAFVLDQADQTQDFTYADVIRLMNGIAADLEARGIRRGDRIGILMENVPHWVFSLMGILRLGAVAVPLAPALSDLSLRRLCDHASCRLIFTDLHNREKAQALGREFVVLPSEDLEKGIAKPSVVHLPTENETALIIYTSGTTGEPKGVEITLANLAHEIRGVVETLQLTDGHRILSVLPFSHVLPLVANGLGPLCIGATVFFLSSISPQRIVEAFHTHRITFFICVPQFFYVLHKRIFSQVETQSWFVRKMFRFLFGFAGRLSNPEHRRKLFGKIHRTAGPDLRVLASGGSRFDPVVARDLDRLGYSMLQAYGLTETAAAATATPPNGNAIGSVGRPIRGVSVRIDSPNNDGVGEICIRGPIVMKGYYRDDKSTSESIREHWFYSGDLGYLRPDGNLMITGRSKEVIILANGKNVYPEELEAHYGHSTWIKELCVMGISSPEGERLHAVVVPDMEEFRRRGHTTIAENIQFDLETLSKQLPSYYHILSFSIRHDPLPRTVTRKLQRFEIQREENEKKNATIRREAVDDHPRFKEGVGAVVANLVRQAKPDAGPLDLSMNLELDLGFDSLRRVELLGLAEAQLGVRIDEEKAARIYTLGEFIEELVAAGPESGRGSNWKEILNVPPDNDLHQHEVLEPSAFTLWTSYIGIKTAKLLFRVFLPLNYSGLEKLPKPPFLLCPNHQSLLDGPLLISTLPKSVIDRIFILGFPDYWQSPVMRFFGKLSRIVQIDASVNLIQAMQVGALGLRKGKVLLIFPEGTRTIDGKVAEFKKGAAILACEIGVPVVPVGLSGAFDMWPRGGSFRRHAVNVAIGEPIDPRKFADMADPYGALTEAMKNAVQKLIR